MGEYKHYIRSDANGIVMLGFTSGFPEIATPQTGDLELAGYEMRQFQLELKTPQPRGQHKYKIVNGQMVERTQEELNAEWDARPAPPKTAEQKEMDKLKADNTNLNDQVIDLWETLLNAGVL